MAAVTYYVALPFLRNDDGDLIAGEAQERQSAGAALREARRMLETSAGAVAFSRAGDPSTGDFDDAVVLERFGETPDLGDLFGG